MEAQPPAGFQYEPLSGNHDIRIASLYSGAENSNIEVTIQNTSISKISEEGFVALSYAWGNPNDTAIISCNKTQVAVTKNLFHALNSFRRSGEGVVKMWIDALCINQKDNDEKAKQLPLMPQIYSRSKVVLIWLGEANASSSLAFTAIDEWYAIAFPGLGSNISRARWRQSIRSCFDNDPAIEQKIAAVNSLVQRSWWTRSWCFQEVILGGPRCEILCGQDQTSLVQLQVAFDAIEAAGLQQRVFGANANVFTITRWVKVHHSEEDAKRYRGTDLYNLSYMLQFTERQNATDPRDKIYSLLALIESGSVRQSNYIKKVCAISYTEPFQQVYRRFTMMMLNWDGNLRVLTQCYRGTGHPGEGPSWVPSWNIPSSLVPLCRFAHPTWGKGQHLKLSWSTFSGPRSCLHMQGYSVGRIEATYDVDGLLPAVDENQPLDTTFAWLNNLQRALGLPGICRRTGRPAIFEILYTLSAESLPGHWEKLSYHDLRAEFPLHFGFESSNLRLQSKDTMTYQLLRLFLGQDEDARNFPPDVKRPRKGTPESIAEAEEAQMNWFIQNTYKSMLGIPPSKKWKIWSAGARLSDKFDPTKKTTRQSYFDQPAVRAGMALEVLRFIKGILRERVFFLLEDGRMGIGPATARIGDHLFELHGAYCPFVLRPSSATEISPVEGGNGPPEHLASHKGVEYVLVGDAHLQPTEDRGLVYSMKPFQKGEMNIDESGYPVDCSMSWRSKDPKPYDVVLV